MIDSPTCSHNLGETKMSRSGHFSYVTNIGLVHGINYGSRLMGPTIKHAATSTYPNL